MGKLSAERFAKLSEGYEKEQAKLKASVDVLRPIIQAAESETQDWTPSRMERQGPEPKSFPGSGAVSGAGERGWGAGSGGCPSRLSGGACSGS